MADTNEIISVTIEIYHNDEGWWLLITGELFGSYGSQDAAIDAIPGALRSME